MGQMAIGKSYFSSLAALDPVDHKRANAFLDRFLENPAQPGHIWSARISRGLRAILHKDGGNVFLLYAGPHDEAYGWARRRNVSRHPATGAIQIVETAQSIAEVLPTTGLPAEAQPLFPASRHSDDYLLRLGVPQEWLAVLREVASEDDLLAVGQHLPEEVAERLLALFLGETVSPPRATPPDAPLEENPDTLRRFFVVGDEKDLADVRRQPLEAWIRFLHPSQRSIVERSFGGPLKVTGAAGTGKTIVAMHRARALARRGKRVLLTSFGHHLCRNLEHQMKILCRREELEHIEIQTVHQQALRLARQEHPELEVAGEKEIALLLQEHGDAQQIRTSVSFLRHEWLDVIDRQGITSWEAYRTAERRGRGRALGSAERQRLWTVFAKVWETLEASNKTTWAGSCRIAAERLERGEATTPFDAVVVDELQDLVPAAVRLVVALGGRGPDALTLIGDAGQRIYPGGFSLRSFGIDVRGRSRTLRINYRTTKQIQDVACRLSPRVHDDFDGGGERRPATLSLLRGPEPTLHGFATPSEEKAFLAATIWDLLETGLAPREIAVFARTRRLLEDIENLLRDHEIPARALTRGSRKRRAADDGVLLSTMHSAKGLEFKAVIVAACSARLLPDRAALGGIGDDQERQEVLARERNLLYVSMTRARDELFVTWSGKPSPFVEELLARRPERRGCAGATASS